MSGETITRSQSFTVHYARLGKAYMIDGQDSLAIENYERSLKLDPGNENGKQKLEELRARAR